MYYNNYYQPFSNGISPYTNALNRSALVRVSGLDGAKAYQMGINEIAPLFDSDNDIFYLKQTDGAGFATYRAFRFNEIPIDNQTSNSTENVSVALDNSVILEKLDSILAKLDNSNNAE